MSKTTNIAWCDSTANPVIGCAKTSPGCAHCYAEVDTPARVLRHRGIETWGVNAQRYAVKGFEKQMLSFNRKPLVCDKCGCGHVAGRVECSNILLNDDGVATGELCDGTAFHLRRVFVGSNCDILDPAWPIETLAHTLDVIRRCPDIVTILCTKRPELWRPRMDAALQSAKEARNEQLAHWLRCWDHGKSEDGFSIPENVWILTSVENQEMADKRIPELLNIPAAVRGLSCEPLLGPINFELSVQGCVTSDWSPKGLNGIGWVIVGGESGHNARPCNVEWIRSLKDQANAAWVACFMKQTGSAAVEPDPEHDFRPFPSTGKGDNPKEWPDDLRVREFPVNP